MAKWVWQLMSPGISTMPLASIIFFGAWGGGSLLMYEIFVPVTPR